MAMSARIELCAELLETVMQENRELLQELQIGKVLEQYKRGNPSISQLRVDEDLKVSAERVGDTEGAVKCLGDCVRTIRSYMELFVEKEAARDNVVRGVRAFIGKNGGLVAQHRLDRLIPDVLAMDSEMVPIDLDSATEQDKARYVFHEFLRVGLASHPVDRTRVVEGLRGCKVVSSVQDDASGFELMQGAELKDIVDQLSAVVEGLGLLPKHIMPALAELGELPRELGIVDRMFWGALSPKARFGLEPLDTRFRDGVARGSVLLLKGAASTSKSVVAKAFVSEEFRRRGCVIVVTSAESPEGVRQWLRDVGQDLELAEKEGRLVIVDWHTRHIKRVTGIEEDGPVIRVSNDLTNLAVGVDLALRRASGFASCRLLLDMVSPTIVVEGFERVQEFIEALRSKLRSHNCTSLVLMNDRMHNPEQMERMEDIFDGLLALERKTVDGRCVGELRIAGYSRGPSDSSQLTLEFGDRGLAFMSEAGKEEALVGFDMGLDRLSMGMPGIEAITSGGLPVGRSYLVRMSTKMMPAEFIRPLLTDGLDKDMAFILVLSSVATGTVEEWLSKEGKNLATLVERGRLQIIDWSSRKDSRMQGVDIVDGVIRPSKDATHLGVGLDMALGKLDYSNGAVAMMDMISSALRQFDLRTIYPFTQSTIMRLNNRGLTSFLVMERGAHDERVDAAMEELFDGIVDIMDVGDHLEIAVLSLRDAHFQSEYRLLNKARDRYSVDIARARPKKEEVKVVKDMELMARVNRLNHELKLALEEKDRLEKNMAEFSAREEEMKGRHNELTGRLLELESALDEQKGRAGEVDDEHRRELKRLLEHMDELLGELPEQVIDRFAESEEFKLYEKIITKYREEQEQ